MKLVCRLSTLAIACLSAGAHAASIYVFSSTNTVHDTDVYNALTAMGHNVVIGQPVTAFTNLSVVSQYEAVYVQANYNWGFLWDAAQQQTMIDYVNFGGGLVTAEWVYWMAGTGTYFQTLKSILPLTETTAYDNRTAITLNQNTANSIMNAGLPTSFTTPTTNIAGVFTDTATLKSGATSFYKTSDNYEAVAGWNKGNGRVCTFSSVNGQNQLSDPNFRRLLGNSFTWVTSNPPTGPGITGQLSLQNFVGTYPANASFFYVNAANGIGSGRVVGTLSGTGAFTVPGPNVPGTYNVFVRTSHWLRKKFTVTTSSSGTVSVGTVSLKNGDCNSDNLVDIADYTILATAFDATPTSSNWDPRADLNGDSIVDIADYTILATNFDAVGD